MPRETGQALLTVDDHEHGTSIPGHTCTPRPAQLVVYAGLISYAASTTALVTHTLVAFALPQLSAHFVLNVVLLGFPLGALVAYKLHGGVHTLPRIARWTQYLLVGTLLAWAGLCRIELDPGAMNYTVFLLATPILFLIPMAAFGTAEAFVLKHTRVMGSSTAPVYGTLLLGGGLGYGTYLATLDQMGLLGAIGVALLTSAAAALWITPSSWSNRLTSFLWTVGIATGLVAGLERTLVRSVTPHLNHPLHRYGLERAQATRTLAAKWLRNVYFELIDAQGILVGIHDGFTYWFLPRTPQHRLPEHHPLSVWRDLDATLFTALAPEARVAIVGAGGGAQVVEALRHAARHIVAIDLVDIFPIMRAYNPAYRDPRVETATRDGRAFFERWQGPPFDLVYLSYVDQAPFLTGPRIFLDTFYYLYTLEGLRAFTTHLAPTGTIVVSRFFPGPPEQRFLERVGANLRELGLQVRARCRLVAPNALCVMVASRRSDRVTRLDQLLASHDLALIPLPSTIRGFDDDAPFALGSPVHALPPLLLYGAEMFVLGVTILLLRRAQRRRQHATATRGDLGAPSYRVAMATAFCIGCNFLLVESYLVLLAFRASRSIQSFHWAMLAMLVLSALGTRLKLDQRRFPWLWITPLAAGTAAITGSPWALVPGIPPLGALLPVLLDRSHIVDVYVFDMLGVAWASLTTIGLVLVLDIPEIGWLTALIAFLTLWSLHMFLRRTDTSAAKPSG